MTYLGIDTVHRFTAADAKNAVANGVSFVCRYLVPQGMGWAIAIAALVLGIAIAHLPPAVSFLILA